MREVADALGVSLASVSHGMRGSSMVSEELGRRIRQKAQEMGYVRDGKMAALSDYSRIDNSERPPIRLAWLNLWQDPDELYEFGELALYYKGAAEAAAKLGYAFEEVVARGLSMDQLLARLRERNVQGLLVMQSSKPVLDMTRFPVNEFAMVRFGLESEKPFMHSVTADQVGNGILAFERVRERGYRRIGFVTEKDQKLPFGAGVFWAQKEIPKSMRVPLLLVHPVETKEHLPALKSWLEKERPDAIITNLVPLRKNLMDLGYRVPEDIALATTSVYDTPIDAGIDQHPEEIGRIAALILIFLLNEVGRGISKICKQSVVTGQWVDGDMLPDRTGRRGPERQGNWTVPKGRPKLKSQKTKKGTSGKRVTYRDIAREVGVSHVTVSLAMRDRPQISEAMRKRIQKKAEAMGYVPDPMLVAMGQQCRITQENPVHGELAWLNLWADPEKLYSYREFQQYWEGAVDGARRHGYHLEKFAAKDIPLQRLDRIFKTRNIRGILVPPCSVPVADDLDGFPWQDYVTVRLGVSYPVDLPYTVTCDDMANGVLALQNMLNRGYRRIAFVGDRAIQRTLGAGFYWAQRMQSVQIPEFFLPLKNPAQHRKKLAAWIQKERPDAIITDNGELPAMLEELGIRVPDEIALATTTMFDTPIDAGIDHNSREVGRMGIFSLISHMNDPRRESPRIQSKIQVGGTWVDGSMMPSRL